MSGKSKQDPAPDFVPEDMRDQGAALVPEVMTSRELGETAARKANWAELRRLPGIGEILAYAQADIDAQGPIDGWTVMEETLQRVNSAETADDILDDTTAVGAEDMVGRPWMLRSIRFQHSQLVDGFPVFLVMFGTIHATGRDIIVTTSAADIIARAYALSRKNLLPQDVEVYQTDVTRQGYRALKLGRPGRMH